MQQNEKTFHDKSGVAYTANGKHLVRCDNLAVKCYSVRPGTQGIDDDAFEDCEQLQQVVLPETVTRIGAWAFYRCKALETMVVPSSVTTIGDRAFSHCKSLKTLLLVGPVKSIGDYAILSCDALEQILIPRGTGAAYQAKLPPIYWPLLKESL
jgi:hypothetical protein